MRNLFLCMALWMLWVPIQAGESRPTITVGIPKAPPALPLLHMIESQALGERIVLRAAVWSTPEQLIAMAQDGRHDMFILPLAVAARLYNKGVGIKLLTISTWGVASLVSADPTVKTWRDLEGKTLFVPLRSSTPDVITRYFLDHENMKPGRDVEIVYSTMAEITQLLLSGRIDSAVLLEPYVTAALMGNDRLRIAFGYDDEWQRIKGTSGMIPNAGLAATTAFLHDFPDLAAEFERVYEKAVAWVHANPDEAGALAERHLGLRPDTIARSLPRLGLRYRSAQQAAPEIADLFRLLFDFSPDILGKKRPDEALYRR